MTAHAELSVAMAAAVARNNETVRHWPDMEFVPFLGGRKGT